MSILAKLALLAIAMAMGFGGGWRVHVGITAARDLRAVQEAARVQVRRVDQANTAGTAREADRERIRTEFLTITEKVEHEIQTEKLVYSNVCVAPGGLQQLADAAALTVDPTQPGSSVPAAAASR